MPEPLTQLEGRVYQYMIDFLAENTYQPSIREIARRFRIKSTKTVSDLLHALESKGYIQRDESRSRGVRLLGFSAAGGTQPVPWYSRVHAGEPALLPEHRSGFMTMDRRFLPSDDVMVTPSARAKDGDIVAARLGGEATVKTLMHNGSSIVLESASDGEQPIEVGPRDDFAVLGVVCGVFRPFSERDPQPTMLLADDSLPASD